MNFEIAIRFTGTFLFRRVRLSDGHWLVRPQNFACQVHPDAVTP